MEEEIVTVGYITNRNGEKAAQRNDLYKVELTAIGYFPGNLRQLLVS